MEIKSIGLASDHAGYEIKEVVHKYLQKNYPNAVVIDYGTLVNERVDYPDFAHKLGNAIDKGEVQWGVAVCGSGNGISMTLNKHAKVRAGLSWNTEQAHLTRLHNNANVLSIPGRFVSKEEAEAIVKEFFSTEFEGGRHIARVDKIPIQD